MPKPCGVYPREADGTECSKPYIRADMTWLPAQGSELFLGGYTDDEIRGIKACINGYVQKTGTKPYAIREPVMAIPELWPLIWNGALRQTVRRFDSDAFLCKSIYFDKTPDANWYVNWHQDISIHVAKKIPTEGFSGWTQKEGIIGVCAPADVLRRMLTVRIHLDDARGDNGALHIIPCSHGQVLTPHETEEICARTSSVVCEIKAGGMHVMQPLLLHRSSKSVSDKPRRVIHLEFTSMELPNGLCWAERKSL